MATEQSSLSEAEEDWCQTLDAKTAATNNLQDSGKSIEEEIDDLLNDNDETNVKQNGSESVIEDQLSNVPNENEDLLQSDTESVTNKNEIGEDLLQSDTESVTEDNFSQRIPCAQSTPARPRAGNSGELLNSLEALADEVEKPVFQSTQEQLSQNNFLGSTKEDELDYSILYEDEDDEDDFVTVSLDDFAKDLDYSLLDDDCEGDTTVIKTEESGSNSENNVTVIENVTVTDNVTKKDETRDESELLQLETKAKAPTGMNRQMAYKIKKGYYEKAVPYWKKTLKPHCIIPNINDIDGPQLLKDMKKQKIIGFESVHEWADKHHPNWQEHRRGTAKENEIWAFIHTQWDWTNTIDITRNLTKFSKRGPLKKHKSSKKRFNHEAPTFVNEEKEIDSKDIFSVLLKNIDNSENDIIGEVGAEGSVGSEKTETKEGCGFCTGRCHCSPGRRRKRPYSKTAKEYEDMNLPPEKILKETDVQQEVRNAMNTQMHNMHEETALKNGQKNYYEEAASKVISSTQEIFPLIQSYHKNYDEVPKLTREQSRELLSVEMTQDRYRSIYKSPYAGQGHSDDEEEDNDEDSDDEIGKVWSPSQIENY